MKTSSSTWTARRKGPGVLILGHRTLPAPSEDLRYYFRKAASSTEQATLDFDFGYDLLPSARRDDYFREVSHLERDVPSDITHIRIRNETGQMFRLPIESGSPAA